MPLEVDLLQFQLMDIRTKTEPLVRCIRSHIERLQTDLEPARFSLAVHQPAWELGSLPLWNGRLEAR